MKVLFTTVETEVIFRLMEHYEWTRTKAVKKVVKNAGRIHGLAVDGESSDVIALKLLDTKPARASDELLDIGQVAKMLDVRTELILQWIGDESINFPESTIDENDCVKWRRSSITNWEIPAIKKTPKRSDEIQQLLDAHNQLVENHNSLLKLLKQHITDIPFPVNAWVLKFKDGE